MLEAGANRSLFLTADWMTSWLEVFGPGHDVVNLAFEDTGDLIGLAPLAVTRARARQPLRRLMLVGQWPTSGEHLDVLARAGEEARVAEALAYSLTGRYRRRWDVLTIQRVLAGAPVLSHLAAAFEERGCRVRLLPTGDSPFVTLPPAGGDLLHGRSKNFREQARQTRRRIHGLGEVEVSVVGADLALGAGFDELLRLHRTRWDGASSFDTPDKVRFHQALSPRLLDRDRLYLSLLRVDGRTIASRYDFVYDDRMWCMQGGWDPEHSSARPGMYLTHAALEWAMERGLRTYEFLGGKADYKARWSTGTQPLVTLAVDNRASPRAALQRGHRRVLDLVGKGRRGSPAAAERPGVSSSAPGSR